DPDRARELLMEFADFTRYSFRRHGEYTTLADELRSIERYLLLEQARFGDRLRVTLRIAPEVLPVAVPFLCIQPLVENAVRQELGPGSSSGCRSSPPACTHERGWVGGRHETEGAGRRRRGTRARRAALPARAGPADRRGADVRLRDRGPADPAVDRRRRRLPR